MIIYNWRFEIEMLRKKETILEIELKHVKNLVLAWKFKWDTEYRPRCYQ